MISLIKNELMKMFQKKSSWIYMILIVAAVIAGGFLDKALSEKPNANWKQDLQAQNAAMEKDLKESGGQDDWTSAQIEKNQKYIEADTNPDEITSWHFMNSIVIGITSLVTLIAVIVCSASVSSEFADGTIKQLLIRPHRRWSILISKYISLLIYAALLIVILIGAGYLTGMVMYGTGGFSTKIFEMGIDNSIKESTVGSQFFLKILYYLPSLLSITAIAFMLSTLFKSQALAVGIGIFVLFITSTLGGIIVMLAEKFEWVKFLIFPHLDLTIYSLQDKILGDITLPISLAILAVYYVLFMGLTLFFFQRKDISI